MYKIVIQFDNTAEDDSARHQVVYMVDATDELKAQNKAIKQLGHQVKQSSEFEDVVAATNLNVKTVGRGLEKRAFCLSHTTHE